MRRVYGMYWGRQLKHPAPRVVLLGGLAYALTMSVSIVNVAINAFAVGGLTQFATFFVTAFLGTTFFVQGVVLAILASVGWFVYDALKKIQKSVVTPATNFALEQ